MYGESTFWFQHREGTMKLRSIFAAVLSAALLAAAFTWGPPIVYGSYLVLRQAPSNSALQQDLEARTRPLWPLTVYIDVNRGAKSDRLPFAGSTASQKMPGREFFYNGPRCFERSDCPPTRVI